MSYRKSLLVGTIWQVTGAGISRGCIFIIFIFLSHYLTKDEYGAIGLVVGTINAIASVIINAPCTSIKRYIATDPSRKTNKEIISLFFIPLIFICILTICYISFFSDSISSILTKYDYSVLLLIFLVFLHSSSLYCSHILIAYEQFYLLNISNIISGLSVVCVFFLLRPDHFASAILIFQIFYLIQFFILLFLLISNSYFATFKIKNHIKELKKLSIYTLPVLIYTIFGMPIYVFIHYMISNLTSGLIILSTIVAATQIGNILNLVISQILSAFFPVLTRMSSVEGKKYFFNKINKVFVRFSLLVFVIFTTSILCLPFILKLFNQEIVANKLGIVVFLFSTVVTSHSWFINEIFLIIGKPWLTVIQNVIWGVLCIIIMGIFIYYFKNYTNILHYSISIIISRMIAILIGIIILRKIRLNYV